MLYLKNICPVAEVLWLLKWRRDEIFKMIYLNEVLGGKFLFIWSLGIIADPIDASVLASAVISNRDDLN